MWQDLVAGVPGLEDGYVEPGEPPRWGFEIRAGSVARYRQSDG